MSNEGVDWRRWRRHSDDHATYSMSGTKNKHGRFSGGARSTRMIAKLSPVGKGLFPPGRGGGFKQKKSATAWEKNERER